RCSREVFGRRFAPITKRPTEPEVVGEVSCGNLLHTGVALSTLVGNDDTEMVKPGDSNEPELRFESYKLIVEDLSRIREQRVRAISSYLTIDSVILTAW